MAAPSARWPHAVFPGLSGNKGRKTPFYSITPAAPGHQANTKESGFIKTISVRKEPNKLIYHQPVSVRTQRTGVHFQIQEDGHPSHGLQWDKPLFFPQCRNFHTLRVAVLWQSGWIWRNLTATPTQSSRQNTTLTPVCSCVFPAVCLHENETRTRHRRRGDGDLGKRRSERKVEMLPGGPHGRQTPHMGGGVRGGGRGGGNVGVWIKEVKKNTKGLRHFSTFLRRKNQPRKRDAECFTQPAAEPRSTTPWYKAVI